MIELIQGNCLDVLDEMIKAGRHVDAIITSPPYNMNLRVHSGRYMSRWGWEGNVGAFSTKYENYKDDLPMDEYFKFQSEFLSKALEVADVIFYNIQMITGNKVALHKLIGVFSEFIKETIIWDKTRAQPAMQVGTLNSEWEYIFVLSKNKPYNRMFDKCNFERGCESNLWRIPPERNEHIKAGFPQELVKRILLDFTNKGNTIMDTYMGSGTSGIVCKSYGRNFIGVELDAEMFKIAKERIDLVEWDSPKFTNLF
jgi:site-specific DNA-methyltransferase (adenine-specific)/modification methylase